MPASNSTSGYAPFDLYAYNPLPAPAYFFLGLFALGAVVHFVLTFRYRSAFPMPLIIGCISTLLSSITLSSKVSVLTFTTVEAAGYYCRSQSHDNVRRTRPYVVQTLMLLSAPPFLAATVYMSPRRLVRALRIDDLSLINMRWLTKIFVMVDLGCFITQVAGSIMSGSEDVNTASHGRTTILVGLIMQIIAFGTFAACVLVVQVRIQRSPSSPGLTAEIHWRKYFMALQAVSGLFLVRNVVRVIEYEQGNGGAIMSTEAYLYVFDSCFMAGVVLLLALFHPGRVVHRAKQIGKKELVEVAGSLG